MDDGATPETYHRGRRWSQAAAAAAALAVFAYAVVRYKPFRVEVTGPSMAPTLQPGDWALAVSGRPVRRGSVVVLQHPHRPGLEVVKRVVAGPGEEAPDGRVLGPHQWWVEGDAPAGSTDSRHFGPVHRDNIRAVVRAVYWPPHRRRLV
jgi:nickel-type superoxide dismutase maturation protease